MPSLIGDWLQEFELTVYFSSKLKISFQEYNSQVFICLFVCLFVLYTFSHLDSYNKNPYRFWKSIKKEVWLSTFRNFWKKIWSVPGSMEKKSKFFWIFFSFFSTQLTNLDTLNTNLKTVLKSDFRFGCCWALKLSKKVEV